MNPISCIKPICVLVEKHPNPQQQQVLSANPQFFRGDFINCCLANPEHQLKTPTGPLTAGDFYTQYSEEISNRLEPAWARFTAHQLHPIAIETDIGFLVVDENQVNEITEQVKNALIALAQQQPDVRLSIPSFAVQVGQRSAALAHKAEGLLEISGYLLYAKSVQKDGALEQVKSRWEQQQNQVVLHW